MIPHPAHGTSPQLRYTANFVWSTSDVLGQGATGFVFKGREKKTGKEYAIKVFNSINFVARSADVRRREFDVLRKVDHENIVRLFDVEEEIPSKHEVIIMELCTAGSLFTILDDPENLYGLNEDEFTRVVKHITAGMKHLHDREIVHRDLKPGNIMRTFAEDGSSVYKLTDFGAARELADNEQFQSLYGTEEYLHPDIYERAVLRKPHGKKFSATVDLWSLGVTLYHVAVGQLPFRPYGGVRRNRETMYKITTEKPSGVISGVQHSEKGSIDWSRELPKACRLSRCFKQLFTPVLSGILECDPHKIWTFERYFTEVEEVLSKAVIEVFCVQSAVLHRIYISPQKTLAAFQEQVAELTDIRSSKQLFLYEGAQFEVDAFLPVKSYPVTTPEHPFLLLNLDLADFQHIAIPHTCKPPKVKSSISLENDSSLAKVCSSTLFDILKSVRYLLLVQQLIRLGVKWFVSYLKNRIMKIQLLCSDLQSKVDCLKTSLEVFEEHYRRETSLLRVISMMLTTPPEVNDLTLFFTQITDKAKYLRQIRVKFDQVNGQIRQLNKTVIQDKTPTSVFVDEDSNSTERLEERMTVCAEKSRDIFRIFKKQKHAKRLSNAEEQNHKFEKQKLSELCESAVSLFTDKSVPGCKKLHKESRNWFINMSEYLRQIQQCESEMAKLAEVCAKEEDSVRNLQRIYRSKLSSVETSLRETAQRPQNVSSLPNSSSNSENADSSRSSGMESWPSAVANKTKSTHRQKQLRELRKGLAEAKSSLHEVKCEVETSSEILRKLGSITSLPVGGVVRQTEQVNGKT